MVQLGHHMVSFGTKRQDIVIGWYIQLSIFLSSLRWHHNGRDSVSNHQPYDCLLNRLFRRRWKKTSKFRVTGLCAGKSPHKWPVTRKMFPFDDVIMLIMTCYDQGWHRSKAWQWLQKSFMVPEIVHSLTVFRHLVPAKKTSPLMALCKGYTPVISWVPS